MIEWAFFICFAALLALLWKYLQLRDHIESKARILYEGWKADHLNTEAKQLADLHLKEWKDKEETRIRKEAIGRSEAVIRGKITEHLILYFPEFPYNPKDARFLGSPVDFIVFNGLSQGMLEKIIFIEVKTGKVASLSVRESMIRDLIKKKEVEYQIIHLRTESS